MVAVLVVDLAAGLATVFAAGLTAASFLASFTGPEGPVARRVSEPSQYKDDDMVLVVNAMAISTKQEHMKSKGIDARKT